MELGIMDRILLLNVLPAEGDITTLRIVRQLREDLSFSEQDHKDFGLVSDGGKVTWTPGEGQTKEVEIGSKGSKLIANTLKKLSDSDKLTTQYVDLYDRFVED